MSSAEPFGPDRASVRRPSRSYSTPDSRQPKLLSEFAMVLTVEGLDYAVRRLPREPGDGKVLSLRLTPLESAGGELVLAEWRDEAPGAADRAGYVNLTCSCPTGRHGGPCAHLRAAIEFGLVRPAPVAADWPEWVDEECWSLSTAAATGETR